MVKGGISAVAETSKDLSEKVISDPTTSQGHLKENLKTRVADLVTTGQDFAEESHAKDSVEKVEKLASKVKHYGAFGESYLGYEDPNKELRKAVKAKEKAAKKARKEKKKKKGKTEDLFDPENLAKFKAELEERKKREAEFAATQEAAATSDSDQENKEKTAAVEDASKAEDKESDKESDKDSIKFTLDLSAPLNKSGSNSNQSSNAHTPTNKLPTPLTPAKAKEETEDWKKFLDLTSGIDSIIKQKKDELEEIKVDSYFQQKKSSDSDKPVAQDPRSLAALADKKKTKKWVDLDKEGFDDIEGSCSESEEDEGQDNSEEKAEDKPEEEDKEEDIGLVEIPEDDPIDLDEEEDLFNTAHVDAVISGDIKLGNSIF